MNNKTKVSKKQLVLNRESVRHLTTDHLSGVGGGMINQTRASQCGCPTRLGCGPDTGTSRAGTACTGTDMSDYC